MRILYFSRSYSPHDHRFLSALAKTPHQIFFLRLEGDEYAAESRPIPPEVQQIHWAGGGVAFRWRDIPRLTADLKRVIRRVQPDLIHAGPIQSCAFISTLTDFRPVLTMSWGFDLMEDAGRDAWWRWVTAYTLKRSAFFTSDAAVTRARAIALGMKPERTAVFPWGVDLKTFRPTPRPVQRILGNSRQRMGDGKTSKRSRHEKDSFVLFCNRAWEPRYGVEVLAQAFVKVARENPNISLILLGAGSRARPIREILASGGVIERVLFAGQIRYGDLPRWYGMAHLFISPSHVDGSSVSLMEALACGRPALVSDIPANREWIRDEVNGWLFPDGNAEQLADKILAIYARRNKLSRIRRAARKTAEERADWNRNFPVLLKAYEKAVRLSKQER